MPSRFDLHFDALKLLNREWTNVGIDATRPDRSWVANITSDQLTGNLSWQPGATSNEGGQLKAQLSKAEIPATVGRGERILFVDDAPNQNKRGDAIRPETMAHAFQVGPISKGSGE